jgi:hypothetical protein
MLARSTAPALQPIAYAGATPDLRISTEKLRCLMLWAHRGVRRHRIYRAEPL